MVFSFIPVSAELRAYLHLIFLLHSHPIRPPPHISLFLSVLSAFSSHVGSITSSNELCETIKLEKTKFNPSKQSTRSDSGLKKQVLFKRQPTILGCFHTFCLTSEFGSFKSCLENRHLSYGSCGLQMTTIWPNLWKRTAINLLISLTPMFEPDSGLFPPDVLVGTDKTCPAGLVVVSGVLSHGCLRLPVLLN